MLHMHGSEGVLTLQVIIASPTVRAAEAQEGVGEVGQCMETLKAFKHVNKEVGGSIGFFENFPEKDTL